MSCRPDLSCGTFATISRRSCLADHSKRAVASPRWRTRVSTSWRTRTITSLQRYWIRWIYRIRTRVFGSSLSSTHVGEHPCSYCLDGFKSSEEMPNACDNPGGACRAEKNFSLGMLLENYSCTLPVTYTAVIGRRPSFRAQRSASGVLRAISPPPKPRCSA